jgi:hypothetical protein
MSELGLLADTQRTRHDWLNYSRVRMAKKRKKTDLTAARERIREAHELIAREKERLRKQREGGGSQPKSA